MDWDIIYTAMYFSWWTIMVLIFVRLDHDSYNHDVKFKTAFAIGWPLFAILAIPSLIKNLIFTSTKEYRTALKDRKLMKEFEQFLELKKGER